MTEFGRIIEVATSIESVPRSENHPLIHAPSPDGLDDRIAVQFVKVNLFRDHSLFSDRNFPGDSSSSCEGWQSVVQLNEFDWIPSHVIVSLAFIFMEDDIVSSAFDDCHGMANFFVLKHRVDRNGGVSVIPRHACPPFPGRIESFCKIWSVDHCELIFNSIRQIRQDMQRMLCRVAQSQGEFAVKNAKLQLPGCSWFYIKIRWPREGSTAFLPSDTANHALFYPGVLLTIHVHIQATLTCCILTWQKSWNPFVHCLARQPGTASVKKDLSTVRANLC